MALPAGITTAQVTFSPPMSWTGQDAVLSVTIKPTHSLTHTASGRPIAAFEESFSASAAMPLSIALPHSFQPGFVDQSGNSFTGWAYSARGQWSYKGQVVPFSKSFQIPNGTATIDIDLLPSGAVSVPVSAPMPQVTSVNGQSGAVTIDTGAGTKPQQLRRYRAAAARAVSGTGLCRIGFAGDSVTQGYQIANKAVDSWPVRLKNLLVASGIPSGGDGMSYMNGGVGFDVDPRLAIVGWDNRYANTQGAQAYGDGKTITFTASEPGTVVEVAYGTAEASSMHLTIDGVFNRDLTSDAPPETTNKIITGLGMAAHTVKLESFGGTNPFVLGVGVRKTAGLIVENGAVSGSTAAQWLPDNGAGYRPATLFRGLDLVFIFLGGNDAGSGTTTAQYKANMRDLANKYLAANVDVAFITETPNQNIDLSAYRDAVLELAVELDAPVVDMFARWGSWAIANDMGFVVDYAHTTPAGAADIAAAVASILR